MLTALRRVEAASSEELGLLRYLLGFPDDLPDLAALRPPGNTRPAGIAQSYCTLRLQGALPATY